MTAPSDAAVDVELIVFEIGDQRFGADASQVQRVDRAGPQAVTWAPLGPLRHGARALVFYDAAGERELRVDRVHGVRTVPIDELRRLPASPAIAPPAMGVWLDDGRAVVLIDLPEALNQGRQ